MKKILLLALVFFVLSACKKDKGEPKICWDCEYKVTTTGIAPYTIGDYICGHILRGSVGSVML